MVAAGCLRRDSRSRARRSAQQQAEAVAERGRRRRGTDGGRTAPRSRAGPAGRRRPPGGRGRGAHRKERAASTSAPGRPAVRVRPARLVRVRRNDVPEQRRPPRDPARPARGGRSVALASAGPRAGELPLGGERNPAHPRPAVAGRLPDEHDRGAAPRLQVRRQPFSPQARTAVLVERRRRSSRRRGPVYQRSQWTTSSSGFQPRRREPCRCLGRGVTDRDDADHRDVRAASRAARARVVPARVEAEQAGAEPLVDRRRAGAA